MRTPSAVFSAAVFSGALWCAPAAAADAPLGRLTGVVSAASESPVVQAALEDPQSAVGHCSVIGAVQHPGTYRTSGSSVLLQTLLEQAGGLSPESSGIVRLLHDGRQQIINLSIASAAVVVPQESVIVADSAVASSAPTFVDVACVQLCDRPVVLCLKPADATLPRLLSLLGQPPELAASVRVIASGGRQPSPNLALPAGTVVLFDPGHVDHLALADVLRRCPLNDLIEPEQVEYQQVAAETVERLESLEQFLSVGKAAPAADPSPAATETTDPLTAPLPTASAIPPTLSQTLAAPEPILESEPVSHQVRPVSALQLQSVSGPVGRSDEEFTAEDYLRAKQRAVAAKAEHGRHDAAGEVAAETADDVPSRWLDIGTSIAAWLLCAFAAYGAFGIWMRQHGRRREVLRRESSIELPKPAPDVASRSALSQLIENSLPMREEETATPSQVFHGRTVGFRYLIRSGPHPLQGPHFAAARVQSPAEPVVAGTARPTAAPQPAKNDRVGRTMNRFDRAVEAQRAPKAPRATIAATAEPAPHGVSPLERALRSLMRDRTEGQT